MFNQYFSTPRGSYGTRIYEFAKRWVRAGHQVTVVTSVYDMSDLKPDGLISRLEVDGIDVRAINVRVSNRHGYVLRLCTFVAYALVSIRFALTAPADVVVASSGPISVAIPALLCKYLRRKPFVFEVRDLWPEGAIQLGLLRNRAVIALLRWFERFCYRSADQIVALSEGMGEWITAHYGFQHLAIIPNASDNELAKQVGPLSGRPAWAQGKKIVLYAGALGYIHNCGQILEIARYFSSWGIDEVAFVVIGDGKESERIQSEAHRRQLSNVHFLGRRSKEDVFRWLQISSCALSLVRNNPFFDACSPNKIFDAFASGVPVVQDTQGWIKRLIETHECGATVNRNDPEAMARAVLAIVHDDEQRTRLGSNARKVALGLLDRDLLATQMLSVLEDCAAA